MDNRDVCSIIHARMFDPFDKANIIDIHEHVAHFLTNLENLIIR